MRYGFMFRGIRCSVYVELMLYVLAVMSLKAPPPALHSSRPAEPRATQPSAAEGPRWALDTSGSQEPMPCLTVPGHFLSSERMAAIANQIQKKNATIFKLTLYTCIHISSVHVCVYVFSHQSRQNPVSVDEQLWQGFAGACQQSRCTRNPGR